MTNRAIRLLTYMALVLLLDAPCAVAQTPYEIEQSINSDAKVLTAAALPDLRAKAQKGDARSQVLLGAIYEGGRLVPKDPAEAARWYRKAADQRFAVAEAWLADMYVHGDGVPIDWEQARQLYNRANDHGFAMQFWADLLTPGCNSDACTLLRKLILAAQEKFDGYTQGGPQRLGTYAPKTTFPGAVWCRVWTSNADYECLMGTGRARFGEVTAQIKSLLPSTWSGSVSNVLNTHDAFTANPRQTGKGRVQIDFNPPLFDPNSVVLHIYGP